MTESDIEHLLKTAAHAGEAIMAVYARTPDEFGTRQKADRSPLTEADMKSHAVIVDGLRDRFPDVPVLSEEGRDIRYGERAAWKRYFCVDPLDGTKEFIKQNDQFCVCIAYIEADRPLYGVLCEPVTGMLYHGGAAAGSFARDGVDGIDEPLTVSGRDADAPQRVIVSLSHPSPQVEEFLAGVSVASRVNRGSALKFVLLARGEADLYPRFNPTMEWDTAAGQAVLEGAGGSLTSLDGSPFRYNKNELINPGFIAKGSA